MALKSVTDPLILEDTFISFPATFTCILSLTSKKIYIDIFNKNKTDIESINLSDVIGCHILQNKNRPKSDSKNAAYFTLFAYPLKTFAGILSKQLRRERKALTFQMNRFDTLEENLSVVSKWQKCILNIIRGFVDFENGALHVPEELLPSRKYLILINPKSGQGRASQIFKEKVIPLFTESCIDYEVLTTDRANCARDFMKKADLSQWNGIVVVSGDGLLFEVYNGLMARSDWKKAVKIPVGVIPGGSGNGLAKALSHAAAAGEPYDVTLVVPPVLNIICGRIVPMDLVKVETEKNKFYSFLSVGWGLMADIDIESERLRAIGEARFAVWGVIRALGLRKYKGRLSYLPVSNHVSSNLPKTAVEPQPKRSKTIDCKLAWAENSNDEHSIFRSKSFGAHNPQLDRGNENAVRLLKFSYSGENFEIPSCGVDVYETELKKDAKSVPHIHCDENLGDSGEETADTRLNTFCPPLTDPIPEDWVVVDDEFVLVYACHQTHLSSDVYFAPEAKMDDGIMWLVMIKGGVSRAQVMYFLASLQTGDHVHIPYVEVIPIHAFRLEPCNSEGFLTVDGEVIPCSNIQAEVLPSIARVMSR